MFDSTLLKDMELGRARRYRNITVFPLHREASPKVDYLPLDEALDRNLVEVAEVDTDGSVPDLLVKNRGRRPVLIIDGEEMIGAKQNRVVNTSLLLLGNTTTKIPVSCTEAGRWSYVSPQFKKSDTVLNRQARASKASSVSKNYKMLKRARANQGEVWEEISELQAKAQHQSPSSAMKDVYDARRRDLDDCLASLKLMPGQQGMVVCVNGRPVGCDYLSKPEAYARLHEKLLRSYVIDALLDGEGKVNGKAARKDSARAFLRQASRCANERYEAPGAGWDHRFEGKDLVGTALEHEEEILHQAFFSLEDGPDRHRSRHLNR
ncbi:MAG: hypothetical protein H8E20_01740 [Verrucomicrobia bacterium]|nr:hypothetical protein [Verrucomicrobiota bacterium]